MMEAGHGGASGRYDCAQGGRLHLQLRAGPGGAGEVDAWRAVDRRFATIRRIRRGSGVPVERISTSSLACVLIWGSTWIAITFQLGRVAPEVSVFYRFLLASLLLFGYCAWRKLPLRYACARARLDRVAGRAHVRRELHLRLLRGAARGLGPGGGGLLGEPAARHARHARLLRHADDARVAVGSRARHRGHRARVLARVRAHAGPAAASRSAPSTRRSRCSFPPSAAWSRTATSRSGLPLWQPLAGACSTARGSRSPGRWRRASTLDFEPTPPTFSRSLYLTVFGSILAFAAYLTLLKRIGAGARGLHRRHGADRRAGDLGGVRGVPLACAHLAGHRGVGRGQRDHPPGWQVAPPQHEARCRSSSASGRSTSPRSSRSCCTWPSSCSRGSRPRSSPRAGRDQPAQRRAGAPPGEPTVPETPPAPQRAPAPPTPQIIARRPAPQAPGARARRPASRRARAHAARRRASPRWT